MTSKVYNQHDAIIFNVDTKTPDGKLFFRKTIKYTIELEIVKILQDNPHPNIVTFYDITNRYFDMELLDTEYFTTQCAFSNKEIEVIRKQMGKAKDHLQNLGISYIDWKLDNIGYCHQTNQYKLFDFDGSGLFDKENNYKWINSPEPFNVYRYSILDKIIDPISMDNNGFNNYSGFGIIYV